MQFAGPVTLERFLISRGGIFSVRCGEILLISSSTLPRLGRVSTKNVNKLTNLNAAVSCPAYKSARQGMYQINRLQFQNLALGEVQRVEFLIISLTIRCHNSQVLLKNGQTPTLEDV